MASKKFKGKTCVYCTRALATTADHVVAGKFFPVQYRANLPKAPACEPCNRRKSELEHYLTAVLPFGSSHPTALAGQVEEVRGRLAKNAPLRTTLVKHHDASANSLPLEGEQLTSVCRLILRGLVWAEWKHVVPSNCIVEAFTLPIETFEVFSATVLSLGSQQRRERVFAGGGLWYQCTRSKMDPGLSTWHLRLYEQLGLAGESGGGTLTRLEIVGITAPPTLRDAISRLKKRRNSNSLKPWRRFCQLLRRLSVAMQRVSRQGSRF